MIQSKDLLKAIETAIPATAIEQAIATSEANEARNRSLPAHLVVCLVVAMSLWSRDSMRDVLKNLVDGLSVGWVKVGKYWRVPVRVLMFQAATTARIATITLEFYRYIKGH
ncbi:hypothetical protein Npun_AR129 (plasmid) [Nostoc punctiforme PCC 73102]|uniref:Transposase IS4 N-terminal domain-containing protein n=1 Tax=Nostoc punctiforme (strain ATCC 29133 / PCC 73102) TaxID=63737 RepID=B2JAP6_NOSP7|nr:transposase domain-containing protein [Nostoc punctiforme]ACC85000.1 hypothetical protein Npun_AR129 [Nostoc punctiforme PCC 73102]